MVSCLIIIAKFTAVLTAATHFHDSCATKSERNSYSLVLICRHSGERCLGEIEGTKIQKFATFLLDVVGWKVDDVKTWLVAVHWVENYLVWMKLIIKLEINNQWKFSLHVHAHPSDCWSISAYRMRSFASSRSRLSPVSQDEREFAVVKLDRLCPRRPNSTCEMRSDNVCRRLLINAKIFH